MSREVESEIYHSSMRTNPEMWRASMLSITTEVNPEMQDASIFLFSPVKAEAWDSLAVPKPM